MIIHYDKRPSLNVDEKLGSLIQSIEMSFNEMRLEIDTTNAELKKLKEKIISIETQE